MAVIERDVVLQGKTSEGNQTIDLPITRLANVEDTADVKETPAEGDYIPIIDGADNGQMKKTPFSAIAGAMGTPTAQGTSYENKTSGLASGNVQGAVDELAAHTKNKENPHGVTAAQLGIKPSDTVPAAPGSASAGSATAYARGDHVHPVQTTVTGNAGSATKLKNAVTISVTGDATGTSERWDGSGDASIPLALGKSGVKAGSYGPNANQNPANGGTFSVPELEVDEKGRVTGATTRTVTLPTILQAAPVQQVEPSHTIPSAPGKASAGTEDRYARGDHVHPEQASVTGNAGTATKLKDPHAIKLTGDATGQASFDGGADASITVTLANSGVGGGSYGPTADASPGFGGTFYVPNVVIDEKGRATSAINRKITLPPMAGSVVEDPVAPFGSSGTTLTLTEIPKATASFYTFTFAAPATDALENGLYNVEFIIAVTSKSMGNICVSGTILVLDGKVVGNALGCSASGTSALVGNASIAMIRESFVLQGSLVASEASLVFSSLTSLKSYTITKLLSFPTESKE